MTEPHPPGAPISIGVEAAPPVVRLPDFAAVFARRSARCRQLADGHPLQSYLSFIAALARAQEQAFDLLPSGLLPGPDDLWQGGAGGTPLLQKFDLQHGGTWILALRTMLKHLGSCDMPGAARTAVSELDARSWSDLLALGQRVLDGSSEEHDAAPSCFVLAAMQVSWTRAAALMDAKDAEAAAGTRLCPMCGSPPVASLVEAAASLQGTRFLTCALCSTQWHFVRIKCANCTSTKGIAYQQIAGRNGAIKAETCDECRTYTKILYLEKDPKLEPFADDLASYALDVLVQQAGWRRAAPNPFLMPIAQ